MTTKLTMLTSTLIACAMLCGCKEDQPPVKSWQEIDLKAQASGRPMSSSLRTVIIDGCQYLEFDTDDALRHGYTHKGDCTNEIHLGTGTNDWLAP